MSLVNIAENLERVREEIRNACISSGRKENEVLLCAVSKFHPAENVVEAIKSGQVLFGENRVQEACEKFTQVNAMGFTPDLHIIGNLQTNKIKKACEIASCPSCAPTTCDSNSESVRESDPIRIWEARLEASSKLDIPVICAFPPEICD